MLTALDLCVIVAYLGCLWSIGLYVAFRHRRRDEGFLVNRRFGWFNIGSSIFATNITPSFLLASSAAAYATGMAIANYEWLACIFLFLLATFFAPHYLRMRISTMPEFIRMRFGEDAANFLSYYGLCSIVVLWIGGDMYVGGKLLNQMLGYPEWACVLALAVVFTSFTAAGGFAAVMVTDTLQAVLMIGSMLLLNIIAFKHVGSLNALVYGIPTEHWQMFRPAADTNYPWHAIVLGYPVLGFWFWCTDQTIVQRMLGARDLRQAQFGAIYTGFLKILPPFLFMMPGLFCLILQPKLDNPDKAFLTMLSNYMPNGMMGLMISVLFAASIAGAAGGLNAFSTIFTMDIYKRKFRPDASMHHLKRVSQITMVAVAISAVGAALFMQGSKKNIFDTLQGIIAFFAPPMASVFLLSIFWKRLTAAAVKMTLWIGSIVSLSIGVMVLREWPNKTFWPHFLLLTFFLFVVCCLLLVIGSLVTKHASYETDLGADQRKHNTDTSLSVASRRGAGVAGWILWGFLAAIMISLYVGFQSLAYSLGK